MILREAIAEKCRSFAPVIHSFMSRVCQTKPLHQHLLSLERAFQQLCLQKSKTKHRGKVFHGREACKLPFCVDPVINICCIVQKHDSRLITLYKYYTIRFRLNTPYNLSLLNSSCSLKQTIKHRVVMQRGLIHPTWCNKKAFLQAKDSIKWTVLSLENISSSSTWPFPLRQGFKHPHALPTQPSFCSFCLWDHPNGAINPQICQTFTIVISI